MKFRGSKIRGWQKILIFAEIKFRDLTKKLRNRKIFLPRKFLTKQKVFDEKVKPCFSKFVNIMANVFLIRELAFIFIEIGDRVLLK